jgi:hypothetical protein
VIPYLSPEFIHALLHRNKAASRSPLLQQRSSADGSRQSQQQAGGRADAVAQPRRSARRQAAKESRMTADHRHLAWMVATQVASWCGLGAKWLLLPRRTQDLGRDVKSMEKPRGADRGIAGNAIAPSVAIAGQPAAFLHPTEPEAEMPRSTIPEEAAS